jgi:DNA-binding transcriptional LysR family regulator
MDLLEKMSTYVRVIEAGSFSAAAKQVRLSPAAVSRQIAALEAEVRFPLVLRSTRRMEVTPAGRRYYERCLRILREVDDAQSVGRSEVLDGLLQVSAPVSFGLARVVPHMHALMSKHPGVRIDLRLEDRLISTWLSTEWTSRFASAARRRKARMLSRTHSLRFAACWSRHRGT